MSKEQIGIFYDGAIKPNIDKTKRNWENRFQRWSNKQFSEGIYGYGACGYGSMCDYCEDNSKGRPCVRALNEKCRVERKTIDYEKDSFEEIWDGKF
jgi:hypothetical protein